MSEWQQIQELARRHGFLSYEHYLESDHWKMLKRQKNPQQCITCPDGWPLVCHHMHYRNLLDVTPADLAVMCRDCHDAFHFICRRIGMGYIGVTEPQIILLLKDNTETHWFKKWITKRQAKTERRAPQPRIRPKFRNGEARKRLKSILKQPSQDNVREFIEWLKREFNVTEHNQMTVLKTAPPAPVRIMPTRVLPPELPIPDCDPIMLTLELVNNCRTPSYGFTNATLKAFGLRKPLIKGWPSLLVGQSISREHYKTAMEGKLIYNSGPLEWLKTDVPDHHNVATFGH